MKKFDLYPKYADRKFAFFIKGQERATDFFKFDLNDKFLKYPILSLDYDTEFEDEMLNVFKDDYYYTASGIMLFSKNVSNILSVMDQNSTFYSCHVKNNPVDIFALYKNVELQSEYVIRDPTESTSYFFSELFINLIEENHWNINYYELK